MNPPALRLLPLCLALLLAGCDEARPLLPANATLPDGGQYRGEIVEIGPTDRPEPKVEARKSRARSEAQAACGCTRA